MGQNQEPRNKSMDIHSTNIEKTAKIFTAEKTVSSVNSAGKIGYSHIKE